MDIQALKSTIESGLPDSDVRAEILRIIASDKNAIVYMLQVIGEERRATKEALIETNLLLSKAHVAMKHPTLNEGNFVEREIEAFYKSGKSRYGHCFNQV